MSSVCIGDSGCKSFRTKKISFKLLLVVVRLFANGSDRSWSLIV